MTNHPHKPNQKKPHDWKARWIGLDHDPVVVFRYAKTYAPCYFRKEFRFDKEIQSVKLHASALGWCEFHVNGQRVGDDYLTPGWTDYRVRIYYNTHDVTDLIKSGDNAIGGMLSGGWYHWPNRGERARLLAQLDVTFADGSSVVIGTDDSWSASTGPERSAHILFGESYDARMAITEWDQFGFDDSNWKKPDVGLVWDGPFDQPDRPTPNPVLEPYPAEPVGVHKEHRPVAITNPVAHNVFIADMGTNFAGFARIRVKNAKKGQIIRLRFGDWLNKDGTLYNHNLRLAREMTDEYVCSGEAEEEIWQPRFTFRGHQYVEISGWPSPDGPTPDDVTGVELTQNLRETARFSCGNETLNKLFDILTQTQRSNTIEAPTDCSQRDERQGWGGDALFFSSTAMFLADTSAFYRKWLVGVLDAQHPDGGFARLAPGNLGYYGGDRDGMPAWADVGVLFPWKLFQFHGDLEVLKIFFKPICRYLDFRLSTLKNDMPDESEFFYGDWNAIDAYWDNKSSEWGADTALAYLAYTIKTFDVAANIADILGDASRTETFRNTRNRLVSAFRRAYVTKEGLIHPTQGNCALALSFNLVEDPVKTRVVAQLRHEFEKHDWTIGTGILSTPEVLFALSDNDLVEEAFNVLLNDEFPSWGYMIKHGATAIWEHWGSRRPELPDDAPLFIPCDKNETSGPGFDRRISPAMNSANHPALGSVGDWMFRRLAGVNSIAPGFKRIMLAPLLDPRVGHVDFQYDSPRGKIRSAWRMNGRSATFKATVPNGVQAVIHLPTPDPQNVQSAQSNPSGTFTGVENDRSVFEIAPGDHEFKVRLS